MGLLHFMFKAPPPCVSSSSAPFGVDPCSLVLEFVWYEKKINGEGEEGRVAGAPPRPPPTSAAASQLLFKYLLTLHLTPASLGRAAVTNLHKQY